MSLNYYPEDDEGYTCRFIFDDAEQGQVVQNQVAYVDVISEFYWDVYYYLMVTMKLQFSGFWLHN